MYNRGMNAQQTKKLNRLLRSESTQLNYILAVMCCEFEQAMKDEPDRMRSEYGECLFRYVENLLGEHEHADANS